MKDELILSEELRKLFSKNEVIVLTDFNNAIRANFFTEVDLGEPGFIAINNLKELDKKAKDITIENFKTEDEQIIRKSLLIIKELMITKFHELLGLEYTTENY